MNWAFDVAKSARLSASERLVLIVLAHRHHDKTNACFPAIDTIAEAVGLSARRVQITIRSLTDRGLISVSMRSVHGRQRANQYDLFGRLRADAGITPQSGMRGDKKSTPQIGRGVMPASPDREEYTKGTANPSAELIAFPRYVARG